MQLAVRNRIASLTGDPKLQKAATKELVKRLKAANCELPAQIRPREDKWPTGRFSAVIRRESHPVELLVVMALSRTSYVGQFGASPNGSVFTADTDGRSLFQAHRRSELTGLSPLLDTAAAIFNEWKRDGQGGRFYVRGHSFFDAIDGRIFFEVEIRDDASDFDGTLKRTDLRRLAATRNGSLPNASPNPKTRLRRLLRKVSR
ncbi:hypothetical protein LV457_19915 [Mycobacterium sp. MYCO198283]|uniref:hypothetical protein n=1 Tax=Mycobacterium sp. MYCO198283 TaxID=2883505 RepID=UPI001E537E71|nr:hypothetical protein [Mycobacterium sp. MYCO198283]MCG5434541.1 hypothetical protein [Mycobacterium sp. MYCO198283]